MKIPATDATILVTLTFLSLAISSSQVAGLAEDQLPNPVTLLKGLEVARLSIPPSKLEGIMSYVSSRTTNEHFFRVQFDGDLRRFVTRSSDSDIEIRSVFDGKVVVNYDGERSLAIRDLHDSGGRGFLFDPRLLGLSTTLHWSETLQQRIPYFEGAVVSMIGMEPVDGMRTHRIRAVDSHGQRSDFWINSDNDFRLLRYEFGTTLQKNVARLEYGLPDYPWLPSVVEIDYYHGDDLVRKRRIDITNAVPNIFLDAEALTIASLQPEVGTQISDMRIKQRLGYWDGAGIADAVPPDTGPGATKSASFLFVILLLLVVGGLLGLSIFHRSKEPC